MIDFDSASIYAGAEQVDDISDAIGRFRSRAGRDSYRRGIESGAQEELYDTVLPTVQRIAQQHIDQYASEIDAVELGWDGRQYQIGLSTDSVIVKSHEYGSGRYNTQAGRTGGDVNGYRITPEDPDGDPLAFTVGGQTVFAEYAVHPGVKPKGFMTKSAHDSTDEVADTVAQEVADQFREALR